MWEASQGVHSSAGTRQLELNFVVVADAEASPTWIPFADGLSDALDRLGAGPRKPRSQSRGTFDGSYVGLNGGPPALGHDLPTGSALCEEGCEMAIDEGVRGEVLRERAIKRLKKRRDFSGHLLVYFLVNAFLVVIWALTDVHGFFWPVFPIVGWGIGVVMNAWDVYRNDEFDEQQIRREMKRLQGRR